MEESGGQRLDSEGSLTMRSLSILYPLSSSSLFLPQGYIPALSTVWVEVTPQRIEKGGCAGNRFAGPRRKDGVRRG